MLNIEYVDILNLLMFACLTFRFVEAHFYRCCHPCYFDTVPLLRQKVNQLMDKYVSLCPFYYSTNII